MAKLERVTVLRRFFIWSALAALIGLLLAGGGYWAYWNFYARFQPVTITRKQAEIQNLLDEASWLSAGGGGEPLYIVGYRDAAALIRYDEQESPKLRAAGVEPRIIVFARADKEGLPQSTPAERATVAELWLSRDWMLYQRWTATPSRSWTAAGIPESDNNIARRAVVGAGREFTNQLGALLRENGVQIRYPLVIWRDKEGFLRACACSDSRSWAFIRDDLGAPDRVSTETAPGAQPPMPEAVSPDVPPDGALPYPSLPAPSDGVITPAPAPLPTSPAPATAQGAPAPAQPRETPQPKKQDDTTFF